MGLDEESIKERLKDLGEKIEDRETFQGAVMFIKALLLDHYPSASPSLRNSFYAVVCHVASTLQTRYTEYEFWFAAKELFQEAERQVADSSERKYMNTCIALACEHLDRRVDQPELSESVLDGQLPMDAVLPMPPLQVRRELLATLGVAEESVLDGQLPMDAVLPLPTLQVARELLATLGVVEGSSHGMDDNTSERASILMQEMVNNMEEISGFQNLIESIEASLQDIGAGRPMRRQPASKEVIEKLPIITVSEEIIARLGSDMECAICRENLDISEKMHELPCEHLFHIPCLKPWLDKCNSCPICRHELPTDNKAYESWKEREREAVLQIH